MSQKQSLEAENRAKAMVLAVTPPPVIPKKPVTMYNELPISMKVDLIREYESETCSQRLLARKYKVARATVNQILKQKQRYLDEWERMKSLAGSKLRYNSNCYQMKRIRKSNAASVNELMEQFIEAARINKWEITGPKLKQRAREIAQQMGLNDFKASNGWLDSFKKRCAIELGANAEKRRKMKKAAEAAKANGGNTTHLPEITNHQNLNNDHQTNTNSSQVQYSLELDQDAVQTPTWLVNYASGAVTVQPESDLNNAIGSITPEATITLTSVQSTPQLAIQQKSPSSSQLLSISQRNNSQTNTPEKRIAVPVMKKKILKIVKKGSKPKRKIVFDDDDDGELKVPHISRVRDAIDVLERFAITKMCTLLPSILHIRQEIGNFVIQQQLLNHPQPSATQAVEHIFAGDIPEDNNHLNSTQQISL
ncbi:uncharacterized protein B4U80_11748 [Leptotrombidium deliense]|uniref:HTH CENPB-type domain-containing protein n=1 Tax=Leptotrombidium deliense TaxID=299467 RepID=A0A443S331_9ACAR|nr:uncharacterized protein B4U80_11748 [Leptotrombidium deliense]